MNIYSNVMERDLINSRILAEQQRNSRAKNIKNRIIKQTQDKKLAENLSPITLKLEEVNETTKNLGEVVKKSDIKDNDTQTLLIEKFRIDIEPCVIPDTALENTLSNMEKQKSIFFKRKKELMVIFIGIIHLLNF